MPATPVLLDESRAKQVFAEFDKPADQMKAMVADLDKRSLTPMTVEVAKEYDTFGKTYLDGLKNSEGQKQINNAFSIHRFLTGLMRKAEEPALNLRRRCARVFSDFDAQERARVRKEQLEREEAIRKQQEAERAAQIEAMKADGVEPEYIAAVEQAPMPIISAPAAKEETKIEGVSMVYSAEFDGISDIAKLTEFLAKSPDRLLELFKPIESAFKKFGTAHLDRESHTMSLPDIGVKWRTTSSPRHRG